MSNDFLQQMVQQIVLFGVVGLVIYFYVAVCLMIIARKTNTASPWMAWVPIANLVLMCRIAKKPSAWVFLLLIPFVNVVVYFLVWMGIARARGKSPGLVFLFLIPPVGVLVVPAAVAAGPASGSGPIADGKMAAGLAGASPTGAAAPPSCPACGRPECVGDEFCGYTGQRIAGMSAPRPSLAAPAAPESRPMVKVLAALVLAAGLATTGYGLYSRIFSGPRASATASVSDGSGFQPVRRAAGTLSLFPVDTAAAPARPVSVVSQNLKNGNGSLKVPAKWLPPGVNAARLRSQSASAITSAEYKVNPQDAPVEVHVIEMPPSPATGAGGGNAATVAGWVSGSAGAAPSGVTVKAPDGRQYSGEAIKTPTVTVYVLNNPDGNAVVIIYAAEPAARSTADRLAGNVGNGQGLNDYPQIGVAEDSMAATLDGGLQLESSNTMDTASILSTDELISVVGNSPEARQWIDKTKSYMPATITSATYRDPARKEWNVLVGNFGNIGRSWYTWMALKMVIGLSRMQSTDSGYTVDQGESRVLLQRRDRYIYLVRAPTGVSVERVTQATRGLILR